MKNRIDAKTQHLLEMVKHQIALKKLIERNYEQRVEHRTQDVKRVELPFVAVMLGKIL